LLVKPLVGLDYEIKTDKARNVLKDFPSDKFAIHFWALLTECCGLGWQGKDFPNFLHPSDTFLAGAEAQV